MLDAAEQRLGHALAQRSQILQRQRLEVGQGRARAAQARQLDHLGLRLQRRRRPAHPTTFGSDRAAGAGHARARARRRGERRPWRWRASPMACARSRSWSGVERRLSPSGTSPPSSASAANALSRRPRSPGDRVSPLRGYLLQERDQAGEEGVVRIGADRVVVRVGGVAVDERHVAARDVRLARQRRAASRIVCPPRAAPKA